MSLPVVGSNDSWLVQPHDSDIKHYLKRQAGVYAAAVADFTEAVQMEPRYSESWKRRGQARSALGENEAALQVRLLRSHRDAFNIQGKVHKEL